MADSDWISQRLPTVIDDLVRGCGDDVAVNRVEGRNLPSREKALALLDDLMAMLFPGYVFGAAVPGAELPGYFDKLARRVHAGLIEQIQLAARYECRERRCADCREREVAAMAAERLLESLPRLRDALKLDVAAAFERDPAAVSVDAVIYCYPGVEAIATHRLAHELFQAAVPLLPRLWSEHAHMRTGIDIHPGASIAPRFFIDHGTGVVVGETTIIGENVALYQGVTLGAMAPAKGQSLRGLKRHPTLEDDVIVYAGATILGGDTVIGAGSVIGGNVWLTKSVPPKTRVLLKDVDLVYLTRGKPAPKADARP